MLRDFAVAVATFISVMSVVLVHDAQQLSTAVGSFLHPAATTSVADARNDDTQTQTAAVAATSYNPDPFRSATSSSTASAPDASTSTTNATNSPQATAANGPKPTIVNNYITQPVIERVVDKGSVLGVSTDTNFVTHTELDMVLTALRAQVYDRPVFVPSFSGPAATTPVNTETFAQSQKIDQLANVTITNPTIIGGSLSGTSGARGGIGNDATTTTFFSTVGHFTTGIIDTLTSTIANFGTITATNASFTNPLPISSGGTGTSTAPTYGKVLLGNSGGTYDLVATSSLGISGGSGSGTVGSGTQGQFAFYNAAGTTLTATSSLFLAQSGNIGISTTSPSAKLAIDNSGSDTTPFVIRTNGSAGNYTAANSSIVMYDSAGREVLRIFAGDPDTNNVDSGNLFIGALAGAANETASAPGWYNTGVGYESLKSNFDGKDNTALGFESLFLNSSGSFNTAIGNWALYYNTTGNENVALGEGASYANTSATGTVAIGTEAGGAGSLFYGQGYTAVGYKAGNKFQTGSDYNTLLGYRAGYNVTTGSNNIIIGTATSSTAIANLTTGSQNILIGNNISFPSATANGQLNIGNILFGTGITGTGSTISSGNIGIGTSSPLARLTVAGPAVPTGSLYSSGQGAPMYSQEIHSANFSGLSGGEYTNSYSNQYLSTNIDTANSSGGLFGQFSEVHVTGSDVANDGYAAAGAGYAFYDAPVSSPNFGVNGLAGYAYNNSAGHTISGPSAVVGIARNQAIGATSTGLWGIYAEAGNTAAYAGATNAYALYGLLYNQAANTVMTNAYGLEIPNITNGGTMTNTYGVHVGDITAGTQTNTPYSFYASDTNALNYFAGKVGVASTSPWRTLSVTGTVGFDGLTGSTGAGSLCLDSNKQVVYNSASDNCLSSTRATKHDIAPLSLDDLRIVQALQPVSFVYNQGDDRTRYGFIAEDTAAVDAHLATYDASGTVSGIDDRSIIAILVAALKDLASKVSETAHLVIDTLTAKLVHSDRVETHELCVDDVCVTRDQFMSVFGSSAPSQSAAAGAPALGSGGGAPASSSAPQGGSDADTATTTTPSVVDPAATPEVSGTGAPESGAAQGSTIATDHAANTPTPTEAPTPELGGANAQPAAIQPAANNNEPLDAANDNTPVVPLPATGTQ